MSDGGIRVVLLARAGEASGRIVDALRAAGADVVLVADPVACSEQDVRDAQPRALVIALEAAIEDALDGLAGLLSDPGCMVLFEDAELAVQREGWEAARWARHLAAKLHGHDEVLPPGGEDDAQWQPSPGPLPPRAEVENIESVIAAFADEAQLHADEVPVDTGLELLHGGSTSLVDDGASTADTVSPFDPVAFETSGLSLVDDSGDGNDSDALAVLSMEPPVSPDADAPAMSLEALLELEATPSQQAAVESADADGADAISDAPALSSGGLSLADMSDEPVVAVRQAEAAAGLDAFETGLSGLSLADPDSYGHGPQRGAVLVDAGLGGPDAVRQLLGAIPEGFPRAVIVRLQLDGGRYDRLVRQMERAAALPVVLATAGAEAASGQIHFMPPELGLHRDGGRLVFDAGSAGELLPQALPDADSALLLRSGASRRLVDATAAGTWSAALVAGQSPDGSYDPDAALALVERGGEIGTPHELAMMLVERWMSSTAPAVDLEEPEA